MMDILYSMDKKIIGCMILTGLTGHLVGITRGYEEGFDHGEQVGRIRTLLNHGHSLEEINQLLEMELREDAKYS